MQTKKESKLKTYIIQCSDGVRKIQIPDDWKVTFGRLHGGRETTYHGTENVLRVYETKEKQRAVFVNVITFMDIDINPMKLVKNKKEVAEILNKKGITSYKDVCDVKEIWVEEFTESLFDED